jgi:tRNA (cytidine/uridine-2'-O-)-methyltransferase
MDYWKSLDILHHANWEEFQKSDQGPQRLWLFTTQAAQTYWDVQYAEEDGLLFGNEGSGAPTWLHDWAGAARRVRIPQPDPALRSLNLSTAAGIGVYEALRQLRGGGG